MKDNSQPSFDSVTETESTETPISHFNSFKARNSPVTYDDVLDASVNYFDGDELAANVWISKYALKNSDSEFFELNPEEMHHRMASEVARIEAKYPNALSHQEIFKAFKDFKYLVPQGGSMSGIGNNKQIVSLSNCFVIGHDENSDSYGAIMKTDEEQVQLMKRRGGVGHDLSNMRPKGQPVKNSAITSTGIVPFMERFSNSTREVAQDGRRGALMLSISIKHPDVEGFIDAKTDTSKITGANVSVKIDDAFMQAVKTDGLYTLQYPINSENPSVIQNIRAKDIWDKIVHNAWQSAEPGILFWDTIINESVPDSYASDGFTTVSTNPCGEIPLCPHDSCRLLALNLYSFVRNPFSDHASFDYDLFDKYAAMAQRVMDDIVDLEIEKIDGILNKIKSDAESDAIKQTETDLWNKIKDKCLKGRRIGIGITAEGDMLAALGITYGTKEGTRFSTDIQKRLALAAYKSSVQLAKERGAFPLFDIEKERENPFINRLKNEDPKFYEEMELYGRRNISMLTIAPTGTTSLMTQTTSGLEPLFSVSYKRRRKINHQDQAKTADFSDQNGDNWEEYRVFHHKFLTWLEAIGYDTSIASTMSDEELQKLIEKSPYWKATSNDINWIEKVEMQGAVQKWVDHSISVTVNLPNETPESMINDIYFKAWEVGCKGITVYRDGSRDGVLITDSSNKKEEKKGEGFGETQAPPRPQVLPAKIIRFMNQKEKWIAVVGMIHDRPYEIFTGLSEDTFLIPSFVDSGFVIKNKDDNGNSRYDFQFSDKDGYRVTFEGLSRTFDQQYWNLAKLISGVLRHGMPIKSVVDVVSHLHLDDAYLNTWKSGVIRALSKFIPDGTQSKGDVCLNCESDALEYQEGCLTCKNCGHSKCS